MMLVLLLGVMVIGLSCAPAAAPAPAKAPEKAPAAAPEKAPAAAPAKRPIKLDLAYILAPVLPSGQQFKWFAEEVTKQSGGNLNVVFHGGTISTKELEIMDMVKTGAIAMGSPSGASATVFPELDALLMPYLFRDYDHVYKTLYGPIGNDLAKQIWDKYNLKVILWYDYGFRNFWNSKRPITKPEDLKGLKMRVQQGAVYADTVNALGASAVPMAWGEVIPAVQQGVMDGADLPVVNIYALKIYEIVKYASITHHNFTPTLIVMNGKIWSSLIPDEQQRLLGIARETSERIRGEMEGADKNVRQLLEPKGMIVNEADQAAFKEIVKAKVWPPYLAKHKALIEQVEAVK